MKLTPTEIIHMNFINRLIELGKSESEIIFIALKGIDERKAKYRAKKKIKELLKNVNNPIKLSENNESKK